MHWLATLACAAHDQEVSDACVVFCCVLLCVCVKCDCCDGQRLAGCGCGDGFVMECVVGLCEVE